MPIRGQARHRSRRTGIVLVIVLICISLLVGVVFFSFNLSDLLTRRLTMQNAADAAAQAGGGWMARSANTIAMNNTGIAKQLSLVTGIDALPLATEMAYFETVAWVDSLEEQLPRDISGVGVLADRTQQGLENLHERLVEQRDILLPAQEYLNEGGFDVRTLTDWPDGAFWTSMRAMDEISQSTAESAGLIAQDMARQIGEENEAQVAFLVPFEPVLPVKRGEFSDFRWALEGSMRVLSDKMDSLEKTSGSGGVIPGTRYPHRLGPWARLHRWRDDAWEDRTWVRDSAPQRGGGGGPGGRGTGGTAIPQTIGHWEGGEIVGYYPYGPYSQMRRQIAWWAVDWVEMTTGNVHEGYLPDTYFNQYHQQLAQYKLSFMFTSKNSADIHYPEYITSYPVIRKRMTDGPKADVYKTVFFVVQVVSKDPPSTTGWPIPGQSRDNADKPMVFSISGWADPNPAPGVYGGWANTIQVADYVWRHESTYETTHDPEIGLFLEIDEDTGEPIWQTVYLTEFYVWCGADIGPNHEVHNPCEYPNQNDLPCPTVMDLQYGDYDPNNNDADAGVRRSHFTFLTAVQKSNIARVWPERFRTAMPDAPVTAIAQISVSNPSSWDFWTQDWEAQLRPVTHWDDWQQRITDAKAVMLNDGTAVNQADLLGAMEYLEALPPDIMDVFLAH